MPLESAQYISELVDTNPPGSDKVLQGDDHLRLIKSVLKATFPNASGPVLDVRPNDGENNNSVTHTSTSTTLTSEDHGKLIVVDTTAGEVVLTLPILTAEQQGFRLYIAKNDESSNYVKIAPQEGLILGEDYMLIRTFHGYAIVHWSGAEWVGAASETGSTRGITKSATGAIAEDELGGTIFATPGASDITLTLPDPATCNGQWTYIKNMGDSLVYIQADGDTIESRDSVILANQFQTVLLLATSGGWFILTGAQTEQVLFQTLMYGATVEWNTDMGQSAKLVLEGDATLAFPSPVIAGMTGFLAVIQDAVGGHELSFNAAWDFGGGQKGISAGANAVTLFLWVAISDTRVLIWRVWEEGDLIGGGAGSGTFAHGAVSAAGALAGGANATVSKSSVGVYTISFSSAAPDANYAVILTSSAQHLVMHYSSKTSAGFTVSILNNIEDSNLTQYEPQDADFSFAVFA